MTIAHPGQKLKLYVGTDQACLGSAKTNKYGDFNDFLVSPGSFTLTTGASKTQCSFVKKTPPVPPTPPIVNNFYRQINVGQNYLKAGAIDQAQPILMAGSYVNKPQEIRVSDPVVAGNLYLIPDKNLVVITHNFTQAQFKQIKAPLAKDGHTKVVTLDLVGSDGHSVRVPLHIYDGLRSKTIDELIGSREADLEANATSAIPYYFEISATPGDFSGQSTPIVDLSRYFTHAPAGSVQYAFDASQVISGNKKPAYNIAHISALGKVAPADQDFSIEGGKLVAIRALAPGIYQFNVRATSVTGGKQTAYQTFYMNVNSQNPTLAAWHAGQVAQTNVIGNYPSIYVYSGESVKYPSWKTEISDYAEDLRTINEQYMDNDPIRTAFYETDPTLKTPSDATGIRLEMNDISSQIEVIGPEFAKANVTLTPSYHYAGILRAIAPTLNRQQKETLVDQLMKPVDSSSYVAGMALDPEGGPNAPGDAQLDKMLADHLAYQGKWLSVYGFADMFNARLDAAFGPMGVANISTYDVGQYRAQNGKQQTSLLPGALSMQQTGILNTIKKPEADQITQAQQADKTCDTVKVSDGIISPQSWCNLSANDSMSENNRRWQGAYHRLSSARAAQFFNGKHQLALPLGASATQWRRIELWNPKLSALKGGLVMVDAKGKLIQNQIGTQDGKPVKMQTLSSCGQGVPLSQCIMVSATPSRMKQGKLENTTLGDYLQGNFAPYKASRAYDVGYSVFALEGNNVTSKNAGPAGKINSAVSEPGYIGWNNSFGTDPAYSSQVSDHVWEVMSDFVGKNY
ncbi:hypothetical protein [Dongshaea marina]|uniref:hypothetical protein n=1 Tax=Dongshaea marina TaxID=2047966 RepID=UPI000D3EAB54|nr:hypothetical protein [Dongshaea marina]